MGASLRVCTAMRKKTRYTVPMVIAARVRRRTVGHNVDQPGEPFFQETNENGAGLPFSLKTCRPVSVL